MFGSLNNCEASQVEYSRWITSAQFSIPLVEFRPQAMKSFCRNKVTPQFRNNTPPQTSLIFLTKNVRNASLNKEYLLA